MQNCEKAVTKYWKECPNLAIYDVVCIFKDKSTLRMKVCAKHKQEIERRNQANLEWRQVYMKDKGE